jgi:hypothetical protein
MNKTKPFNPSFDGVTETNRAMCSEYLEIAMKQLGIPKSLLEAYIEQRNQELIDYSGPLIKNQMKILEEIELVEKKLLKLSKMFREANLAK